MVSFLLSKGAHPNIQDKKGRTPVMLAAELGNYATMALLTQKNADLMLQDAEGKGEQEQTLLVFTVHVQKMAVLENYRYISTIIC